MSPFVDENDTERYIPDREKELRGLTETKQELVIGSDEEDDKYDIIAENKKNKAKKVREQKEFAQISKNVMTSKNRKLLKVVEHSVNERKAAASKLK